MRSLGVAAAAAIVAIAMPAVAQTQPQITVGASSDEVEVGEPFNIQLKAMVAQGDPSPHDAEIAPPREFQVLGKNESQQFNMVQRGMQMTVEQGLATTWRLVGNKPGRFVISGPVVVWNGRRIPAAPIKINVVAAGSSGRSRRQQPTNPFLMPGGPNFGFPFIQVPDDEPRVEPRLAPELAMPTAPDPYVFVHAKTDKKSAVVGQQITLSIYVYRRKVNSQPIANHDPPLSDFLRVQLAKNPGTDPTVIAMAGSEKYQVDLFDQMAIFPLKAGDLHVGQVRYTFGGAALRQPVERASEDLVIHVTEPPRAGRPVGYVMGDVGQFKLAASVAPRKIEQGGEVAVTLTLSGTGNLPQSLRVPEKTGLEWLDPEKKDAIEPQHGVVQGSRTFGYVVRIKNAGSIDLGEVTLPFWDPESKQYRVEKAVLGAVEVTPKAPITDPLTKEPLEAPAPDPFVTMPGVRAELGAYTPPRARLLEGRSLWMLVAAPPLAVGLISTSASALRRARRNRAAAKDSPAALAQKALADAREAEAKGDGKALASALERAIHLMVESATSLKSRGVLVAELPDELEERGIPRKLADQIADALEDCDAVRFDPAPDSKRTGDLSAAVRAIVSELTRVRRA